MEYLLIGTTSATSPHQHPTTLLSLTSWNRESTPLSSPRHTGSSLRRLCWKPKSSQLAACFSLTAFYRKVQEGPCPKSESWELNCDSNPHSLGLLLWYFTLSFQNGGDGALRKKRWFWWKSFLMHVHPEPAASTHLISTDLLPMSISQTRILINILCWYRVWVSSCCSLSFIILCDSALVFIFTLKTSSYKHRVLFIWF